MDVINLFSVPIFVTELKNQTQKLKKEEIEILKNIKLDKQYGDNGNYLSQENHILKKYKLDRIKNLCDEYVNLYTESILGITDTFKMFKSWLSMNELETRHDLHSHRNTMISCVLYFDENMSSDVLAPINFWQDGLDNIFRTFQFRFKVKEKNQYNDNVLTVYPKTNTLIVFPAWVKHGTEPSNSSIKH